MASDARFTGWSDWLDDIQMGADAIGVLDPTPFTDTVNGLLYLLRDKPEEAMLSFAGIIPLVGDAAKLGKVLKKSGLGILDDAVQHALPAPRQVQAHWGAGYYRHGGLTSTIEHIMYRHSWESGFKNVSRFAKGTSARDIMGYVDEALRYGQVKSPGQRVQEIIYDVGHVIGVDLQGQPASRIRVIIENHIIRTAHPL